MPRSYKFWTTRELREARFYAEEGLSISRTAKLLNRSRGELGAAASRYNIKFAGEYGAPFDNHNRTGKVKRSREDILQQQRLRMRRLRERRKQFPFYCKSCQTWVALLQSKCPKCSSSDLVPSE